VSSSVCSDIYNLCHNQNCTAAAGDRGQKNTSQFWRLSLMEANFPTHLTQRLQVKTRHFTQQKKRKKLVWEEN